MALQVSDRQLEEIRYHTDIVELIGSYVTLKRAGSSYKACCPFHKEKTPSFHVNPGRQSFKCFGCGEGGDAITFVMKQQGLDFMGAVRVLAERCNVTLEERDDHGEGAKRKVLQEIHSGIAGFYQRCLKQMPAAEAARTYLRERQLDGDVSREFGVGYAPAMWDAALQWAAKNKFTEDQMIEAGLVLPPPPDRANASCYDRFRDRLMFPIWDTQGRVIGFSGRILQKQAKAAKYVNSPETPLFHKSRVLYALDKARKHIVAANPREAIVCEGQIDVIRCHAAGFSRAVASQGTAFTDDHVSLLKRHADGVVIVFDSDSAGQDAAVKTARLFVAAGMVARVARLPDGQDPDTYICEQGTKAFQAILDDALSAVGFEIEVLSSRERDPNALDAIDRMSKEVLQTIALCPNAIHRAKLLEEAGKALHVPISAMEQELAGVSEKQAQQAQRAAARSQAHPVAAPQSRTAAPVVPAPPPDIAIRTPGHPADELALCEHLVHVGDFPELAAVVKRYLPMDMISDELCRGLMEICLRAADMQLDVHDALQELGASEDIRIFAEGVFDAPNKITVNDWSRVDAAHDLILRIWRRRILAERTMLQSIPSDMRTGVQRDRWRDLMQHDKSLRIWELGSEVIELEMLDMAEGEDDG